MLRITASGSLRARTAHGLPGHPRRTAPRHSGFGPCLLAPCFPGLIRIRLYSPTDDRLQADGPIGGSALAHVLFQAGTRLAILADTASIRLMKVLANVFGSSTVAASCALHHADMAGEKDIATPMHKDYSQSRPKASHQVIAGTANLAGLALAEALSAAYANAPPCDIAQWKTMNEQATSCRTKEEYAGLEARKAGDAPGSGYAKRHEAARNALSDVDEACMPSVEARELTLIHESFHSERLPWTNEIEERSLEGPSLPYVSIVDSYDGALAAGKSFWRIGFW